MECAGFFSAVSNVKNGWNVLDNYDLNFHFFVELKLYYRLVLSQKIKLNFIISNFVWMKVLLFFSIFKKEKFSIWVTF